MKKTTVVLFKSSHMFDYMYMCVGSYRKMPIVKAAQGMALKKIFHS